MLDGQNFPWIKVTNKRSLQSFKQEILMAKLNDANKYIHMLIWIICLFSVYSISHCKTFLLETLHSHISNYLEYTFQQINFEKEIIKSYKSIILTTKEDKPVMPLCSNTEQLYNGLASK